MMHAAVSQYVFSGNPSWSNMLVSGLSTIFTQHQFHQVTHLETLWDLKDNDLVIYDKASLGNPASQLISPLERGGKWLIVNSDPLNDESAVGFIALGFSGLIVRDYTLEMLPRAIRALLADQLWFSREAMSSSLKQLVNVGGHCGHSVNVLGAQYQLSAKEQQVFHYLLQGKSNKEIALGMNLSLSTVKNHVSNILQKTHKQSRHQLTTLLLDGPGEKRQALSVPA
ncbi:response regulator transcription factor [Ferrimonas balearica]|uniref:response regulator transcription factor n=1 Tax=Ferrimonas balearica TaxID=44012 RepID=UPI001C96923E|nr:response regulator transcription factor [Ferrimonas balearica]MBY5980498.1 response regulator transcription factor [Ferrimonas balearica]